VGGELCDLKLLVSELVARVVNPGPCVLAGDPELGFGAPSKGTTTYGEEMITGSPQLFSRLGAATLAPEPLSVEETCSGQVPGNAGAVELLESFVVESFGFLVWCYQGAAAG
jgi:hypothetical protein